MNKLKEYKENNPVTWRYLAGMTGLTSQYLQTIANMDEEMIRKKLSLDTYLIIKEKLNINLLSYE